MSKNNSTNQTSIERYKTTFMDNVKYDLTSVVPQSFLESIMSEIARRGNVSKDLLDIELSSENNTIEFKSPEMENALKDAAKYKRSLTGISIKTGIVNRGKVETGVYARDHHDITFNIRTGKGYSSASVSVYGVSVSRDTSQDILDWGNGVIADFKALSALDQKVNPGQYLVDLNNGHVSIVEKQNVQKVEVVNPIKVQGLKWYKERSTWLWIVGTIITVTIAVIGWRYFTV